MTTIESTPRSVEPAHWTVDGDQSSVVFAVKTFWGLATVHGHFERFDGSYEIGPDGLKIKLTIEADSLDTGNRTRDEHLRSHDFFHVDEHPQLRFTSTRIRHQGNAVLNVEGVLEAVGKVVPLAFDAWIQPTDDGLEIEAITTIDPQQLGMSSGPLGMIRPPATVHIDAHLTTEEGEGVVHARAGFARDASGAWS
jgi:polyisoprenoid-binding protein YceI